MEEYLIIFADDYFIHRYVAEGSWQELNCLGYYSADHGGVVEVQKWYKPHSPYARMEILYKGEPVMIPIPDEDTLPF